MKHLTIVALVIAAFLIAGCGGSKYSEKNLPGWVQKGSGVFADQQGKAFYGVGAVSNIDNVSLMRTAAETNARTDLARVFKTHIQDLVKIYNRNMASGGSGEVKVAEEQLNQQATKALTDMELSGSMIVDHYYDEGTKTEYALAKFDPAQFKDQLAQMQELNADVKQIIEKNAEKAFDELSQEAANQK